MSSFRYRPPTFTPSWSAQRDQTITPETTFADAAEAWMKLKAPPSTAEGRPLGGYIRENIQKEIRLRELDPEPGQSPPKHDLGVAQRHSRYLDEYQNLKAENIDINAHLKNM